MPGVVKQSVMQVATEGLGVPTVGQSAMLVAYAPPGALAMRSSFGVMQVSTLGQAIPACSHTAMLVAYRTGVPEDLKTRAWSFVLDGHTFYVVTLGEQGTFVYDFSTEQWAKWQTLGYTSWNMHIGTTWRGDVIAADADNPVIWRLNPESFIDNDFKPQKRSVTGGLAMRNRAFISNYDFTLTASLGEAFVPNTLPVTTPVISLSFSDDQGKTFTKMDDIVLNLDDFEQEIRWGSLGTMKPPQRVFKIEDTGAIVRIDGADADVGEEGS